MIDTFEKWWNEVGSGIAPKPTEDHEEHTKRVAYLLWKELHVKYGMQTAHSELMERITGSVA